MTQRDDDCQPQTDDWLLFTGESESESLYAAGIRTTKDEDRENDDCK